MAVGTCRGASGRSNGAGGCVQRNTQVHGVLNLVLAGLVTGLLFGAMDAVFNANPPARRLHAVCAPVAKGETDAVAGSLIDLASGLVIAQVYVQLAPSLPGGAGLAKGMALGLGIWIFRVVMSVATTWMTHRVPPARLTYQLATGLAEMLVLGATVGLMVRLS